MPELIISMRAFKLLMDAYLVRYRNIYIFGGNQPQGDASTEVWAYNPDLDEYSACERMPAPNRGVWAGLLPDGRIIVLGIV